MWYVRKQCCFYSFIVYKDINAFPSLLYIGSITIYVHCKYYFKCRGHLSMTVLGDVINLLIRCVGNENNDTDLLTPSASLRG